MPRLRRKGHQKRPGALDNAHSVGEMETAAAAATLPELTEFFDRVLAGEYEPESEWMLLIARKRIRDELFGRFRSWCASAPPDVTDETLEQAHHDHRLPEELRPQPIFESVTGRKIIRNALQAARHEERRMLLSAAIRKKRYDAMTELCRQRLHDPTQWPTIRRMRPELAAELSPSERREFDAMTQAAPPQEHVHNLTVMPGKKETAQ